MPAVEQAMVKVKARTGFSAPGWSCERGDEMDVTLADARRIVSRGLGESADERVKKMSPAELEDARRVDDEAEINETLRVRLGLAPIEAPTGRKRLRD